MFAIYFGGALLTSLMINTFFVLSSSHFRKSDFLRRFGGIGIIITFVLAIWAIDALEKTNQISALLFGVFAILVFGIIDDIKNCSWKKQMAFQVFLALLLVFSGYSIQYISGPFGEMIRFDSFSLKLFGFSWNVLGSLAVVLWVVLIINSVNWADGIDGLAGSIALIGAVAIVIVSSLKDVNQPAIMILGLVFAGSVLGFLWYNFPLAKIEAGTSGSYAIGFILAGLAIIAGTKIATAMIILAVPLIDFLWVICERFFKKIPITKKDKRHLHYKLRAHGWSDTKIVLEYSLFISVMLFFAFFAPTRIAKFGIILFEIVSIVLFLWYIGITWNNKRI